jgi:hypothetical protein
LKVGDKNQANQPIQPIATRWAAPADIFVEPVEKVSFGI